MVSRRRLENWGGAFLAAIGLAGCGGISEEEGGPPAETAGTAGTANAGAATGGSGGTGANGGTAGNGGTSANGGTAGNGGTGAIGRPFLVAGRARTANAAERSDWIARDALSAARPQDEQLAAALAEHWLLAARMEHASVAAFARFSLELLALGAPSDLLLQSARAMQDETVHAELCFALASRYAQRSLGPAPLSVESALDGISLESAVTNALIEGCIGETLAAAEAQAACEHAKDPVVREILERVADDETRHAALAFRFVAWALARGDARITEIVRHTLNESIELAMEASADSTAEATLLDAGVLPANHRADVRRYAYETIVLRALRALLQEPEATTHPIVASC